jgi:hypothetical protein
MVTTLASRFGQLTELPTDWRTGRIADHAIIKTGSRNTQDRIDDGKYPFFVRSQIVERINDFSFNGEAVLTAGDGVGTGKVFHYIIQQKRSRFATDQWTDGIHSKAPCEDSVDHRTHTLL